MRCGQFAKKSYTCVFRGLGVDFSHLMQYNNVRNQNLRLWRNRQTRTFEGRMGDRMGSSPIYRTKNPGFLTRVFLCLKCLKPSIYKAFLSLREFSWISLGSLKIVCVAHALHTRCTRPVSGLLKGRDVSLFCATALIFYGQLSSFRFNSVAHYLAIVALSLHSRCTLLGKNRQLSPFRKLMSLCFRPTLVRSKGDDLRMQNICLVPNEGWLSSFWQS